MKTNNNKTQVSKANAQSFISAKELGKRVKMYEEVKKTDPSKEYGKDFVFTENNGETKVTFIH